MSWGLYAESEPYNIMPLDEQSKHTFDTTCKCGAEIIEENGIMIILHSSFDGREAIEEANEILKKTLN